MFNHWEYIHTKYMAYFWKMKVALKPGFGHKTRGVDAAVPQATSVWEMSLKFLPVSPVEVKKKLFNFVIRFIIYCFVGCSHYCIKSLEMYWVLKRSKWQNKHQSNHNLNVGSLDEDDKLVTKTTLGEEITFTRKYLINFMKHPADTFGKRFLGPDKEMMRLGYTCERKRHTNAAKNATKPDWHLQYIWQVKFDWTEK